MDAGILHTKLLAADIPIDWVECGENDTYTLHFLQGATQQQIDQANSIAQSLTAVTPNWQGFKDTLWGTSLFTKAFETTNAKAWSLLLHTLESSSETSQRLAAFELAINGIRSGLNPDFTTEEITQFNQILSDCNFDLQL